MSNFAFLQVYWPDFANTLDFAEKYVYTDPASSKNTSALAISKAKLTEAQTRAINDQQLKKSAGRQIQKTFDIQKEPDHKKAKKMPLQNDLLNHQKLRMIELIMLCS